MSVTANIVTQADQDVITVPNAAITTQGGIKLYSRAGLIGFRMPRSLHRARAGSSLPVAPRMVPVTVGISNDTETEITSGVQAGDQIIAQTIKSTTGSAGSTGATGSTSTRARSVRSAAAEVGGGGLGGGGAVRYTGGAAGR